jgi:hypothetical protein
MKVCLGIQSIEIGSSMPKLSFEELTIQGISDRLSRLLPDDGRPCVAEHHGGEYNRAHGNNA